MTDGIKRRDFLKVLGVSGAGAGLVGCSTENVEKLLPYVVPPEDITPGVATWYSTVCRECAAGCGMWVRTREGRAVKLEGNPNHPVSQGALCARGHSALQSLYSPDRFPGPRAREDGELVEISWDDAEQRLAEAIAGAGGNVLFLSGALSLSMTDLVDQFLSTVGGSRVEHNGLFEAPLREATRIAFGRDVIPRYDLEAARFIVSFGADFLETWISPVEHARGFARSSGVAEDGTGKAPFVFVGPRLSLTGQNADEWIPVAPGAETFVALGMASILAAGGADAGPYASILSAYGPETAAEQAGVDLETLQDLADRFASAGPSVALGSGLAGQHRNATAANLAVHILNAVAGNIGQTVHLSSTAAGVSPYGEMEAAIRAMAAGEVGVVMVHRANPVYALPPASGFADAFAGVPLKVAFASEPDETTALADLVLPDRHFLEAWGDSSPRPGSYSVQQPVMRPVPHFDSKQTGDVLISVATRAGQALGPATFFDHLRSRWQDIYALSGSDAPFELWWKSVLKTGIVTVDGDLAAAAAPLRSPDAALSFEAPALDGDGEFTLLVYPSSRFGDGRQSNRPWMHELPDPVSKLVWQSWVEVHPDAAERLGVRDGDYVRVASPHGEVEVPVWVYPGIRSDVVAIAMGNGHEVGRWAAGQGVNPMALLPAVAEQPSGGLVHLATRVSLTPTGARMRLATIAGTDTQHDRNVAPAVALADLGHAEADHDEGGHGPLEELQLGGGFVPIETEGLPVAFPLPGARYGDYANPEATPRWAMAIDLDKCTGCSACVVACQAENNVPWVGEDQVRMGRDLHWMRIERYYETVDASHAGPVDVRHLPMLCQHCGNAPCEPVCPVFAAYHTPDGLNGQVYNRCVGTRYCANNCPYKVRVFNWYTYTDVPEPMNWQYNPDVTVRENGVMEKCSFCVHRIREAQNLASLEGRGVREGEVITACQQSCPAEAIVFGNARDPESRVAHLIENERTYRVLDELINTQPAVNYLKKVTLHEVAAADH